MDGVRHRPSNGKYNHVFEVYVDETAGDDSSSLKRHVKTYLGAGYSNLRSGIDVDSTVSLSGNRAAHCIGDAYSQSSPLLTITQGHEAICSLTWKI